MNALEGSALGLAMQFVGCCTALKVFTDGLAGLVEKSMQVYSSFETIETGLNQIMGSAEKGKEAFEDLRKFSNSTTFGVDELASASTQLMNVGMQFEEVKKKLTQLGDVAGGSKEKFADLVSVFAKIQSTGKATSMQINQMAMRGVPIIQVLKDMGVQGSATAEDISEAFERMAGAGGQFHGAMENILNTIEGKKGEIADFGKELTISFVEATGIVDIYKAGLDLVRGAVVKISEALAVINKNPIMKAILSGLFYGSIVMIAGTIIVALIPAIKKLIVEVLQLNSACYNNPYVAIIGAITTTLGILVSLLQFAYGKAKETHAEAVLAQKEQIKYLKEYRDAGLELDKVGGTSVSESLVDTIDKLAEGLVTVKEIGEAIEFQAGKWMKLILAFFSAFEPMLFLTNMLINKIAMAIEKKIMTNMKKQNEEYAKKIYWLGEWEAKERQILELEKLHNQYLQTSNAQYKQAVDYIDKEYTKIGKTPLEQEIEELKALYNKSFAKKVTQTTASGSKSEVTAYYELDNERKKKLEAIIKEKEAELEKQNTGETWAQKFKNATGESVSGYLKDNKWVKQYVDSMKKNAELQDKMRNEWGEAYTLQDDLNAQDKKLTDMKKSYMDLIANGFDTTEEGVRTLNDLNEAIKKQKEAVEESRKAYKKQQTREVIGDMFANFGSSISGDFSSIAQGAEQGGIWGAIINVFLNAIQSVIQGIEGADEVLNPITTAMQTFKPVLTEIIKLMVKFQPFINGVLNEIAKAFEQLLPILDAFSTILQVINGIISGILLLLRYLRPILKVVAEAIKFIVNLLFGWLLGALNSWTSEIEVATQAEEENANALEKINEQYRSLTQSLREYEEYYLKKRRELNAENEINKLTAVNDMILTPNGKFSTHPDDYIIATKNPYALNGGNGGSVVNVVVKNEVGNYAEATATQTTDSNGNAQLLVTISKKIASDVATGSNGWDNALRSREFRLQGSRLSM